jgi:hypothetical protein
MCYIKYLDMFRAILCSSSGGQNCIFTASSIVTLCERSYSAPVESWLQSALNRCKIQFWPPEDEHSIARNMLRYLMKYIYYRMKELCIKLVIKTSLYYDARSEKHQITLPLKSVIFPKKYAVVHVFHARPLTESDDTRCCIARNMSRYLM